MLELHKAEGTHLFRKVQVGLGKRTLITFGRADLQFQRLPFMIPGIPEEADRLPLSILLERSDKNDKQ